MAKVDFKQTAKNFDDINRGLKDVVDYTNQLKNLEAEYSKSTERQRDVLSDVLDRTKDIFKNRKALADEQLTSVDLHKLERRLIAEGLEDQVKFVQQLKEEDRIQKQINRTINAQAKIYDNIGSSIDSFVRKIPGIGGMLADVLGTGDLGKEMSESFRTEISRGGGLSEFGQNAAGEFAGGFATNLFVDASGTPTTKKAIRHMFKGGLGTAMLAAGTFAAAAKMFSIGMQQGFQSQGVFQATKRFFAGGAFEGIRAAFGTGAKAERGTLFRLMMNRRRFGITEADQAKILAAQVNIAGLSQKSALNIQSSLASSAAMRGVLPEDVFQDIANNTENFAAFAKDGGQNIGEAAIRARELGVSLDTVFKISDSILDFQSSIENELQASLLIGRQLNLNEARRLAMAGDMAGLQEEIVRQIGSEEELQKMNAIARKKLAGALGVTVSELNRLASGELEVKNSDMKQNTSALNKLTLVMGAVAASQGLRIAGAGLQYFGQVITPKGFDPKVNMRGYSGRVTKAGLPDMRTTAGRTFMAGQTPRGLASPIGRMGTFVGSSAGQVGLLLAGVTILTVLVKKLVGSSEETAQNTKRSVAEANFVNSSFISSNVVNRN